MPNFKNQKIKRENYNQSQFLNKLKIKKTAKLYRNLKLFLNNNKLKKVYYHSRKRKAIYQKKNTLKKREKSQKKNIWNKKVKQKVNTIKWNKQVI